MSNYLKLLMYLNCEKITVEKFLLADKDIELEYSKSFIFLGDNIGSKWLELVKLKNVTLLLCLNALNL